MKRNSQPNKLAKVLTYCGTLPLLIAIAMHIFIEPQLGSLIGILYAAVIVSFIAGSHWIIYLNNSKKLPFNLLITSNFFTLLSFASLIFMSFKGLSISILLISFGTLFLLDHKLFQIGVISTWYYNLRRNATGIVMTLLIILICI